MRMVQQSVSLERTIVNKGNPTNNNQTRIKLDTIYSIIRNIIVFV
jgi:hypothetical protein